MDFILYTTGPQGRYLFDESVEQFDGTKVVLAVEKFLGVAGMNLKDITISIYLQRMAQFFKVRCILNK
jgi:hypothetical protein